VRTLLVAPAAESAGFRCGASGRLVLQAEDCDGDGPAQAVTDVIDDAIEEALRQGTHVDVVEDPDARAAVQGLAALLRFKGV
jgi:peptide subunit release factor 1 (eRF1)